MRALALTAVVVLSPILFVIGILLAIRYNLFENDPEPLSVLSMGIGLPVTAGLLIWCIME
jgi:hypothetical protein